MSTAQNTFSIKDLPCQQVVVFKDRAEVKRLLKAKLKKGENELVINSISNSIDRDSVRVEGHGNATVLDVVCQNKTVELSNLNTNDKVKELKKELESLESKQQVNRYKNDKINRQINVLNEFANTMSRGNTNPNPANTGATIVVNSKESVDNFFTFIDSYSTKLETLSAEKHTLEKQINEMDEQIRVAQDNLNRLSFSNYHESIEITILLEASQDDSEVNLVVSYLVYNASWYPKYDIRVFSKDKSMTINYYGLISQSTGEDWNETKLSLSTAVPSIGGNVPELETVNVQVKQPPPPPPHFRPMAKKSARMSARKSDYAEECEDECETLNLAYGGASAMPLIAESAVKVQTSSVGSTSTYEIPRSATIPSDNNTHKVSIGIINLKPDFEYETVPKKSAHAFIKAKVTNSSEYALLSGQANVFLDNNFVAKTQLKDYSPQEEFDFSLGVDPSIKVEYKPVKVFKAQTGLINKSTSTTYVQVIEVKNTSPNSAKVLLVDNLPLSNDEKIQVKLIEPDLKKATNVKLNKQNNLEFELNIPGGKKEEITIKYSVDHPSDKEIEFM